jgi:hypothetical protein
MILEIHPLSTVGISTSFDFFPVYVVFHIVYHQMFSLLDFDISDSCGHFPGCSYQIKDQSKGRGQKAAGSITNNNAN